MNIARVAVILLFATTFTLVGWLAPVLYATYVPANQVIEVHDFTADDTTTESDYHYICFDRTVKQETSGRVFTELYLVDGSDKRIEIESDSMQRYFQSGRTKVITPYDLPEDLREGEYRYLLVVQLQLADGRVKRSFSYKSDPFVVENGSEKSKDLNTWRDNSYLCR